MKYNGFEIPDNEVDNMVDVLECSISEACEIWLADHDKIVNEEQEKADKKAKAGGRHYEKSANPRKNVKKERKIDENKAELLDLIRKSFGDHPDIEIIGQKTETELYLEYDNAKYTVKLTKHRPKK